VAHLKLYHPELLPGLHENISTNPNKFLLREGGNDLLEGCEWIYRCPLSFDQLKKTSNPNIRFCNVCSKKVYNVTSKTELQLRITKEQCMVIHSPTADSDTPPMIGSLCYIPKLDD